MSEEPNSRTKYKSAVVDARVDIHDLAVAALALEKMDMLQHLRSRSSLVSAIVHLFAERCVYDGLAQRPSSLDEAVRFLTRRGLYDLRSERRAKAYTRAATAVDASTNAIAEDIRSQLEGGKDD